MPKLFLNPNEKKAIEEFKYNLHQKLGREVFVLRLFGSKARGDFKNTSDIDILILLRKNNLKNRDLVFQIAAEILIKHNIDLSIKIFSEKEYKESLNLEVPFFLNVQKEGVAL